MTNARSQQDQRAAESGRRVAHLRVAVLHRHQADARIYHIALDPNRAIPLALIANEATTNAFKGAFPDGRSGTVQIRLQGSEWDLRLFMATSLKSPPFGDGVPIPDKGVYERGPKEM